MTASANVTEDAVSRQYEQDDGILVCSDIIPLKFSFCLSTQIDEHLS